MLEPGFRIGEGGMPDALSKQQRCIEPGPEPTPLSRAAIGSVKNLGRYAASWISGWPNRPSSTAALT